MTARVLSVHHSEFDPDPGPGSGSGSGSDSGSGSGSACRILCVVVLVGPGSALDRPDTLLRVAVCHIQL